MATVYKQSGRPNWMIAWYRADGIRKVRSSRTTDKRVADRLAAKLEADAMLAREGIVDPRASAFAAGARRPLDEHAQDFLAYLRHKGDTEKHVSDREGQLTRLLKAGRISRVADLTPARVRAGLNELQTARQISLRTTDRYMRAIKGLSRWLVREGRAESDGLVGLTGKNPDTDRRHERRALTEDEIGRLVTAAEAGPEYRGLSGPDRSMLYRIALGTGFRANEIASLTPTSFDLDADPPTVTVEAAYSKRRRKDVQPMRTDLAELIRPWLADHPANRRIFDVPHLHHRTAHMVRHDLALAGLPYRDDNGKVADFHSLRVSFVSAVVRAGASIKEAQTLARHCDPSLTFKIYAKTSLHDLGRALAATPPTAGCAAQETTARAGPCRDLLS